MLLATMFLVATWACTPEPPVEDPPTVCASGFILDGSICVPESCGTGRWGSLAVDDDTVYVDTTAEDEGDGTEGAPLRSIQAGVDAAGALGGGLVAVAAGTYPETLSFTTEQADVRLTGRCRELVILDANVGDEETPGIDISAGYGAVEVTGLTVRDSSYVGFWVDSGDVKVHDMAISGSALVGMAIVGSGARVAVSDTLVRDTRPDSQGMGGLGVDVQNGATFSADGCLVDENTSVGFLALGSGTQVTIRNTRVTNTKPDENGEYGRGIGVQEGATFSADGCFVGGNSESGLFAENPDTLVTLRDTTVKDTRPDGNGEYGRGIQVQDGANLSAETCLVMGNTESGLFAADPNTQVTLRDTIVRDTRPNPEGTGGRGIEIKDGVTLSIEGCLIEENSQFGLFAAGPDSHVMLRDTTVAGTIPDVDGSGIGVGVQEGAALSAESCLISGSTDLGLYVSGIDTRVVLEDTRVTGTQTNADGYDGFGIYVEAGAALAAEDCLIDGNTRNGLNVHDPGTRVTLHGTIVRDTRHNEDGVGGVGIQVSGGAALFAVDCIIARNNDSGLIAGNPGTQVNLSNTIVKDTRAAGETGRGVGIQDGAILSAEGCIIEGNTEMGLSVSNPGSRATLRDTLISNTRPGTDIWGSAGFGANVQDGGFLSASRLVLASNQGPGLIVNGEASAIECSECLIEGSQFAGAVALSGGSLSISDSTIESTSAGPNLLGGAGVYAWPWFGGPPTVILENSVIRDNPIAGVWLIGNGTFILTGNIISGGRGEPIGAGSRCGDAVQAIQGVTAWDGASGLLLRDNRFLDASGSGVFLDDSSAHLDGNAYSGNTVDLVVQEQSCTSIPACYSEAPRQDLCPEYSYPACYAEFFFVALPAEPVGWEEDK